VIIDGSHWAPTPAAKGHSSGATSIDSDKAIPDVHHIFFDDNVLRRRTKIVDVRFMVPKGYDLNLKVKSGSGSDGYLSDEDATPGMPSSGAGPSAPSLDGLVPTLPFPLSRGVVALRCELLDGLEDNLYFMKEVHRARAMWPMFKKELQDRMLLLDG